MAAQDGEESTSSPVSAMKMDRGVNLLDILNRSVPEQDDWDSKTIHDVADPGRVAALRVIGQVIPHIHYQQDTINEWLEVFMKNRTSRKGEDTSISRREIYQTIQAAFGVGQEDNQSGSIIVKGTAADLEDD